jgi:hypothetical protein
MVSSLFLVSHSEVWDDRASAREIFRSRDPQTWGTIFRPYSGIGATKNPHRRTISPEPGIAFLTGSAGEPFRCVDARFRQGRSGVEDIENGPARRSRGR